MESNKNYKVKIPKSESAFYLQIKRFLIYHYENEVFFIKYHGGTFSKVGIPDILGCYKGKFFAIELKLPSYKVNKEQLECIEYIRKCKGIATVLTWSENWKNDLIGFIELVVGKCQ